MQDSIDLITSRPGMYIYVFRYTFVHKLALMYYCIIHICRQDEESFHLLSTQIQLIENLFNEAMQQGSAWLLVIGHHPIYSSGGFTDNLKLGNILLPIFKKYNINAYFSGHYHISEHLRYFIIILFISCFHAFIYDLTEWTRFLFSWLELEFPHLTSVIILQQSSCGLGRDTVRF